MSQMRIDSSAMAPTIRQPSGVNVRADERCASGEPLLAAHATIGAWPKGGEPWPKPVHGRPSREPYWRRVLARWKRSGLSVRAFCRAEGLNALTFYWWRRELERRDQPQPAFLPVHVVAETTEPPTGGIEVVLANGRCLRVGAGFDPRTLVRVVELLEPGGRHAELASDRPHLARGPTGRSAKIVRRSGRPGAGRAPGDPLSGDIFVFRNKAADRIKLLL